MRELDWQLLRGRHCQNLELRQLPGNLITPPKLNRICRLLTSPMRTVVLLAARVCKVPLRRSLLA